MHRLTFLADRNLLVLGLTGPLDVRDGKAAFLDLFLHPGCGTDVHILTDARDVTDTSLDFAGMLLAAQGLLPQIGRLGSEALCVILVGNETHFGMARMLEQIVEALAQRRIRVVGSVAEAARELGLDPDALTALLAGATAQALPAGGAGG
jgi:hypothetical protein